MLPSIDTYLSCEISDKLKIILSNRYIIEEILKGIQPQVSRSFIRVYGGESGRDIPVLYTLPQEKVTQQGAIYIALREGQEDRTSLGNLEDTYEFKEQGILKENSVIQYDVTSNRNYFEVSRAIGELVNVEGISFSKSDNVEVEGKRIYFANDPELLDLAFNVLYVPTTDKGVESESGFQKGFTATESYSVVALSTNMDTVRCLDLIIKAILIMMRENPQEKNNMLLQRLQFGQIEEIDIRNNPNDGVPELLYGRETIVTYSTSYSLEVPIVDGILKELKLNLKLSEEG